MIDRPMTMVGMPKGPGNGKSITPSTKIIIPTPNRKERMIIQQLSV